MDPLEFSKSFDVTISRYELYPAQEPTGHAVGFSVVHKTNGLSMYVDTEVALDADCMCERMKCNKAWEKVKATVYTWADKAALRSALLNTPFTVAV